MISLILGFILGFVIAYMIMKNLNKETEERLVEEIKNNNKLEDLYHQLLKEQVNGIKIIPLEKKRKK